MNVKEHEVVFLLKNCISKKLIKCKDLKEAEIELEKKRKLNPRSKWILICEVQ